MKVETIFIKGGDPENSNESILYRSGELGKEWTNHRNGRLYQRVKVDSGATALNAVGVVAAGQTAFWKDETNFLVTNDLRMSSRNQAAGIFTNAVTAGYYTLILKRGKDYAVKAYSGGTYVAGTQLIANSGTAADVTSMNVGTAPTYNVLGIAQGARDGVTGKVTANIDVKPSVE